MPKKKKNSLIAGDYYHTVKSIRVKTGEEELELQPSEDLVYIHTESNEYTFLHLCENEKIITVSSFDGIKKGLSPELLEALEKYHEKRRKRAEEMDRKGIPRLY